MFKIALQNKPNLKSIKHCFLEVGHTRLEADTIHARIERHKPKDEPLYLPEEWLEVIETVPHPNSHPLKVVEMKYSDFYNFKALFTARNSVFVRRTTCNNGSALDYHNVKYVSVERDHPRVIFLRNSLDPSVMEPIRAVDCIRKKNKNYVVPDNIEVLKKYSEQLPISNEKYDDLQYLVTHNIIPPEHHDFYKNLKHQAGVANVHADILSDVYD